MAYPEVVENQFAPRGPLARLNVSRIAVCGNPPRPAVGVRVTVALGVKVAEGVIVRVTVLVGVNVDDVVGVAEITGVDVTVAVRVTVKVDVGVKVRVGVRVAVDVRVTVVVKTEVNVRVGVRVRVTVTALDGVLVTAPTPAIDRISASVRGETPRKLTIRAFATIPFITVPGCPSARRMQV
jgi:hypothetical protein